MPIKINVTNMFVGNFARSIFRQVERKCLGDESKYFHFCSRGSDFLTGPSLAVTVDGTGICAYK